MSKDLQTANETSLSTLTEQERSMLQQASSETGSSRRVFIPQMKLSGKGSKANIPEGHFFIVVKDEEDPEKKIINIDIGEHPEVVIMKRMYSYSWYSKGKEKLLALTNEFDGFDEMSQVQLINCAGSSAFIEFEGDYPAFKKYKDAKYYDQDEGRSKLKFTNVLYVYFENEYTSKRVFRMFVSNSSVAGIAEGSDQADYKNPQPQSLISFIQNIQTSDTQAFFGTICRLGSELKEGGIEYYMMTFDAVGSVPDIKSFLRLWYKLGKELDERQKREIDTLPRNEVTSPKEFIDVEIDDLPDL